MPRCKHCKEKFTPRVFLQKYCLLKDECIKAFSDFAKSEREKKERKEWNDRKKAIKPITHPKKFKYDLQKAINLLARNVDKRFGYVSCIDCDEPFLDKTPDGGHFNSVGSNATLRYNLHNIHSQRMGCNRDGQGGGKRLEYYRGLVSRYGEHYAQYIDNGMQKEFTYIGLKDVEYPDKIAIVRKINREFDTYQFTDAIQARKMLNQIIAIYEK